MADLISLTEEERLKFMNYLRQEIEAEKSMAELLEKQNLPGYYRID